MGGGQRKPPQSYWVSLAGRRHPSQGEKVGEGVGGVGNRERRWEEREGLTLRKKKRKGRAKINND